MVIILVDHLVAPCANLTYYWRVFIPTLLSFGNGVTGYVEDRGLASRLFDGTPSTSFYYWISWRHRFLSFLSILRTGQPSFGRRIRLLHFRLPGKAILNGGKRQCATIVEARILLDPTATRGIVYFQLFFIIFIGLLIMFSSSMTVLNSVSSFHRPRSRFLPCDIVSRRITLFMFFFFQRNRKVIEAISTNTFGRM